MRCCFARAKRASSGSGCSIDKQHIGRTA
jgi:hypothetical protein